MTVEPSELRELARQVMAGLGTPADEDKSWSSIIELGWLLVAVPEELGGLDMGGLGASVLHAELGRHLAEVPFLPAMLVMDALCQSALADRDSWLARILAGEMVTAPLADCRVSLARRDAGGPMLSGLASAVQSADKATHALVWTADGDAVLLVALDQAGVEVIERPTWDVTRRLFDLRFDSAVLNQQQILASEAAAGALVRRLLTQRDFALAADAIGAADTLLAMTVEYLRTRRQFGRPLALFQALKHRCADLKTQIAAADALLFDSLGRFDGGVGAAEAELKGRAAKQLAASTFSRVAEEALQLHGGIGMASEHPCHLFLKRALLTECLGRGDHGCELDSAAELLIVTSQ